MADILEPLTGETFDDRSIDSLGSALALAQANIDRAKAFLETVRQRLAAFADFTEHKTVRLRGDSCRIKLEAPDDAWDQAILRDIVATFPTDFHAEVIKVASLRVSLREYDKIIRESGNKNFMKFRAALLSANRGPVGLPRATLEKEDEPTDQRSDDDPPDIPKAGKGKRAAGRPTSAAARKGR